ncbi:MAG: WS/DGAT domain-containing protein, partial [Mycobacterium sp.]
NDGGGSFATDIRGSKQPAPGGMGLPTKGMNPLAWVGSMARGALRAATAAEHAALGVAELTASLLSPAPWSSLHGPVTTMRRYSVARVRLADLHKVSRAFGVTLNDVALAAITSSYRQVLLDRGERPSSNSLRTLVPVSVRSANHFDMTDNQVSALLPLLPVDEGDPVEQLHLVHNRLTQAKASGQIEGGSAAVTAASSAPFALSAWAIRLLAKLPQRAVVALATNVPGSRGQQTLMGRRVVEMLPIPPIALQVRTGVAMISYADSFIFGITADYDTAPDIDALARGIEDGVAQLVAAARARRRKPAPGPGKPATA